MKKLHFKLHLKKPKKPDIKGTIYKIRHLKKEDIIAWRKAKKERRERILEERRNSAFAKNVDEPAVTPVPCTACMCDQSGYRSHIQTFSVSGMGLYGKFTTGVPV